MCRRSLAESRFNPDISYQQGSEVNDAIFHLPFDFARIYIQSMHGNGAENCSCIALPPASMQSSIKKNRVVSTAFAKISRIHLGTLRV